MFDTQIKMYTFTVTEKNNGLVSKFSNDTHASCRRKQLGFKKERVP